MTSLCWSSWTILHFVIIDGSRLPTAEASIPADTYQVYM